MNNKCFLILTLLLFLSLNFISSELDLEIDIEQGDFYSRFTSITDDDCSAGYDYFGDGVAVTNNPSGNIASFYSKVSGNNLSIDCWPSSSNTRTIDLVFFTSPSDNDAPELSWSFSDTENYDATLYFCLDSNCDEVVSPGTDLEAASSKTYSAASTPRYFQLVINYDPETTTNPNTGDTGGGGGGGGTSTLSLKLTALDIILINGTGFFTIPITIENNGRTTLNNINLTAKLYKNDIIQNNIPLYFDKNLFTSLTSGQKENITVSGDIGLVDDSKYKIIINATVSSPSYNTQDTILLNFLSKDISGIIETLVFSENLIKEHPECLELKDMIDEAKKYYLSGDKDKALEKANSAVEACRNYLNKLDKKSNDIFKYDKFLIYLGLGILIAIILGIIFNIYKHLRFRYLNKKEEENEKSH